MNRRHPWWAWVLSIGAICAWLAFHLGHVIACMDECLAGVGPLATPGFAVPNLADLRLSAWILSSSQHALANPEVALFEANAFYPAPQALAGAEHLLGLAVWSAPLRLINDGAVFVHQAAYVLSYGILGATTLAFVRWLTGSLAIATIAALASMAMPWRISEMAHLQLLAACWVPLCWLLTFRLLERRGTWVDVVVLVVALALQLLTSYYIAYMLTLSLAVIAIVVIGLRGIDARSFLKLSIAAAIPYALLVLVSLPYLQRNAQGELLEIKDLVLDHTWLWWGIEFIRPRFGSEQYSTATIPAGVLLFAALALAWWRAPRTRDVNQREFDADRARLVTGALWLVCVAALVMMFPPIVDLGGWLIHTPVYLLMTFIPGFENIRAPHRWAVLIGLAMPVLAALGVAWLARMLPANRRQLAIASATAAILVSMPWTRLEVARADGGPSGDADLYVALSGLPPGPVLELPWEDSLDGLSLDSEYMLASTKHGRPILNGYTGYWPPSYYLLRRIAAGLPSKAAIEKLARLSGVRWIIVHRSRVGPVTVAKWRADAVENGLRPVYLGPQGMVFAMPQLDTAGAWVDRIRGEWPPTQTLGGHLRARLELPEGAGAMHSFDPDHGLIVRSGQRNGQRVSLTIDNGSGITWPGLDLRGEGLVHLSYAFSESGGDRVIEGVVPIDDDLPAGESKRVSALLRTPELPGEYRLRLELVQRIDGRDEPLPIAPLEMDVPVTRVTSGG